MNNLYVPRNEASRNYYRREVNSKYKPSEEIGTSFTGKVCVCPPKTDKASSTPKEAKQTDR